MKERKPVSPTRAVVATAIGAALFFVFFYFVKIPSPIPQTNIQFAYAISAFVGTVFGPVVGGLSAFIGHVLNDALAGYGLWWSWIIASGVAGLLGGLAYFMVNVEKGYLTTSDYIKFNLTQIIAQAIAWIGVAPILDIVIYNEPTNLVFTQGAFAFVSNTILTCIVGSILLALYARTRTTEGSLSRNK